MRSIHGIIAAFALVAAFSSCDSSDGNGNDPNPVPTLQRSGGMVLVEAKGKSFQMGSADGNADEQPVRAVSFSRSYWIDTTEVTQGEYERIMRAEYAAYSTPDWTEPYGVGSRIPAYLVEWGDAVLYCNARSKAEGLAPVYAYASILGTPGNGCALEGVTADLSKSGYRLPTEAEWEYACRGGVNFDFFWGKNAAGYPLSSGDSTEIGAHAVWAGNSWNFGSDDARFGFAAAASRTANAFGLYDMVGNAWEWCHDWYDATYYGTGVIADPEGPASGDWHTLRGGSWGNEAPHLRATNREFSTPDYLYNFIGFRAVRTAQ
ncbi:MAG: SUMF1/EgtB/PvdO family nonheme iron enzyme [Bacteroidetes bacterium]|nr:SUMF1/EgtB/PvdO family nonheme iron enzyme [Bacteroidota bacterium]